MNEKLEAAYEELREIIDGGSESFTHADAVQYLKDVLAKQEQGEPVAYGMRDTMIGNGNRMMYVRLDKGQDGCTVPLYEHPQPKQEQGEPVAWFREEKGEKIYYATKAWDDCLPLYTALQQRKPLTDEQITAGGKALAKLHAETCGLDFDDVWKYYAEDHKADAKAAIEAAHGIKE